MPDNVNSNPPVTVNDIAQNNIFGIAGDIDVSKLDTNTLFLLVQSNRYKILDTMIRSQAEESQVKQKVMEQINTFLSDLRNIQTGQGQNSVPQQDTDNVTLTPKAALDAVAIGFVPQGLSTVFASNASDGKAHLQDPDPQYQMADHANYTLSSRLWTAENPGNMLSGSDSADVSNSWDASEKIVTDPKTSLDDAKAELAKMKGLLTGHNPPLIVPSLFDQTPENQILLLKATRDARSGTVSQDKLMPATMTLGKLKATIEDLKTKLDSLSNEQQQANLTLQSNKSKQDASVELMSTWMKKIADLLQSIIGNMR